MPEGIANRNAQSATIGDCLCRVDVRDPVFRGVSQVPQERQWGEGGSFIKYAPKVGFSTGSLGFGSITSSSCALAFFALFVPASKGDEIIREDEQIDAAPVAPDFWGIRRGWHIMKPFFPPLSSHLF